jgi:branched-chain amino acid transport system permease protein
MEPCGIFQRDYAEDKAVVRTKLQWGLLIALLVLVFTLPLWLSPGYLGMLRVTGIYIIAVLGLNILMGYCGQISLGHAAFMGAGAYTCAKVAAMWDMNFILCIIVGGIGGTIFGLIFALPAARIKGMYIALTTLAAQFVFAYMMTRLPESWFGGSGGIHFLPAHIGNVQIVSQEGLYYLTFAFVAVFTFIAVNISRSKIGRAFQAIRDNDLAAEVMGINVFAHKLLAFAISGFFAGVAGALWAYSTRYVTSAQFTLWSSIWMAGMVIVGGMGSNLGSVLGVIVLRGLEEGVTILGPALGEVIPALGGAVRFSLMNVLLGLVIILFLIFEPRGLSHRWQIFKAYYRQWPFPYL